MKAAVPFENGRIFQHFGKTSAFLVAEIEDQEVKSEQLRSTNGSGHGALSALLSEWGQGAVNALSERGICVVRGVDMDARMALAAFAKGALKDDPDASCHHHEHEGGHDCGSHSCAK